MILHCLFGLVLLKIGVTCFTISLIQDMLPTTTDLYHKSETLPLYYSMVCIVLGCVIIRLSRKHMGITLSKITDKWCILWKCLSVMCFIGVVEFWLYGWSANRLKVGGSNEYRESMRPVYIFGCETLQFVIIGWYREGCGCVEDKRVRKGFHYDDMELQININIGTRKYTTW